MSALTSTKSISGPEFTMRYNLSSGQINARPRPATVPTSYKSLEECSPDHASRDGL